MACVSRTAPCARESTRAHAQTPPPPARSPRPSLSLQVILAIILSNKTNLPDSASIPVTDAGWANYERAARFAGYAVFWSGLGVGLTNLGSGCVRWSNWRVR